MKTFLLSLALLFASTFSFSQGPTKAQIKEVVKARKEVKKMEGMEFPDFAFTNTDGELITTSKLEGKYILFNFWFTSCRPCIEEIPELNAMVASYTDDARVAFLAPTFENQAQVTKFSKRFTFDYDIIPDEQDFCLALNIRSYPTHFIVNPEGIIEKVVIGYSGQTVNALRRSLDKLLRSE